MEGNKGRRKILICGAGSGHTTLVNSILEHLDATDDYEIIEHQPEDIIVAGGRSHSRSFEEEMMAEMVLSTKHMDYDLHMYLFQIGEDEMCRDGWRIPRKQPMPKQVILRNNRSRVRNCLPRKFKPVMHNHSE